MKIQIPINISVITDFDEHMSPEEEIFLKEQLISMFAEYPLLIRKRKMTMRKPFSSETLTIEIKIIEPEEMISASGHNYDTDFINKKKLIESLWEIFGDTQFVSRNVIAQGSPHGVDSEPLPLGERLEEILGKHRDSSKSVGKLLGKMIGRVYGDLVMSREDTDRSWWVIKKNLEKNCGRPKKSW